MNNKIATGIWLVFIGIVILLHNMDVIHFNFYAIIKYWPLAIVSVGISLLLQNRPNGVLISTACNILICAFLIIIGMTSNDYSHLSREVSSNHNGTSASQAVHVDLEDNIGQAKLNINGGAATFAMVESTDTSKLFQAWTNNPSVQLKLKSSGDETKKITLNTDIKGNNKNNAISFYLHPSAIWDLEINLGAATFNADFTPYTIQSLEINSGASSMDMKFGQPREGTTDIEINTGASSIDIRLPKGIAYYVEGTNVLSSTRFEGAKRVKKGEYTTDNYGQASHRYKIKLTGAANSFSISTYE